MFDMIYYQQIVARCSSFAYVSIYCKSYFACCVRTYLWFLSFAMFINMAVIHLTVSHFSTKTKSFKCKMKIDIGVLHVIVISLVIFCCKNNYFYSALASLFLWVFSMDQSHRANIESTCRYSSASHVAANFRAFIIFRLCKFTRSSSYVSVVGRSFGSRFIS